MSKFYRLDHLPFGDLAALHSSAMVVEKVVARTIYDSRGNPTVECDVHTALGVHRASVPSGASTGIHEAVELRDEDPKMWSGQGVLTAIKNIESLLGPAIMVFFYTFHTRGADPCLSAMQGMHVTDQEAIDQKLRDTDGTADKSALGANAIMAISLAVARAGAEEKGVPLYQHLGDLAKNRNLVLPTPCFNVINGGVHAGNTLAQQEFMICPTGAATFCEGLRWATEVYHKLKGIIQKQYGTEATNVGDEGGFAPPLADGLEALDLIERAIKAAGYEGRMMIAFDSAASEFFKDGLYDLGFKQTKPQKMTRAELGEHYEQMILGRTNIAFLEDPFAEDDWEPCKQFTATHNLEIIGDDMLCTNPARIKRAIEERACSGLLLKVNQIGTITEAIQAVKLAKDAGWGVLTSHRSGETTDDFIADLSVGLATGHIKAGAPARGERLAKYNQLSRIEQEMAKNGRNPKYAGENFRFVPWI